MGKKIRKSTISLKVGYPSTMSRDEVITHIKAALNQWQVKVLRVELGITIKP